MRRPVVSQLEPTPQPSIQSPTRPMLPKAHSQSPPTNLSSLLCLKLWEEEEAVVALVVVVQQWRQQEEVKDDHYDGLARRHR